MPTCIETIYRIESDPNRNFSRHCSLRRRHKISKSQIRGKIQGRVTHSSDSYPEERIESVSTPTLTDNQIRWTLRLDYSLKWGLWMKIEAGIEAYPNSVKEIYPQLWHPMTNCAHYPELGEFEDLNRTNINTLTSRKRLSVGIYDRVMPAVELPIIRTRDLHRAGRPASRVIGRA